jgi:hypothetical protein
LSQLCKSKIYINFLLAPKAKTFGHTFRLLSEPEFSELTGLSEYSAFKFTKTSEPGFSGLPASGSSPAEQQNVRVLKDLQDIFGKFNIIKAEMLHRNFRQGFSGQKCSIGISDRGFQGRNVPSELPTRIFRAEMPHRNFRQGFPGQKCTIGTSGRGFQGGNAPSELLAGGFKAEIFASFKFSTNKRRKTDENHQI